jgi:hypothetical protein
MSLASRIFDWPGSFSTIFGLFSAQTSLNIYPQVPGTASLTDRVWTLREVLLYRVPPVRPAQPVA